MNYDKVNILDIKYNRPVKDDKCYMAFASYSTENKMLSIKSPPLKCTNIMKIYKKQKYKWCVEFELQKSNKDFYELFTSIEDYDINTVHMKSEEWFGELFSIDVVDDYQKAFIKIRNKTPRMRLFIEDINDVLNNDEKLKNISNVRSLIDTFFIITLKYVGLQFLKQTFVSLWSADKLELIHNNEFNMTKFNDINDGEEFYKNLNYEHTNQVNIVPDNILIKNNNSNHVTDVSGVSDVSDVLELDDVENTVEPFVKTPDETLINVSNTPNPSKISNNEKEHNAKCSILHNEEHKQEDIKEVKHKFRRKKKRIRGFSSVRIIN